MPPAHLTRQLLDWFSIWFIQFTPLYNRKHGDFSSLPFSHLTKNPETEQWKPEDCLPHRWRWDKKKHTKMNICRNNAVFNFYLDVWRLFMFECCHKYRVPNLSTFTVLLQMHQIACARATNTFRNGMMFSEQPRKGWVKQTKCYTYTLESSTEIFRKQYGFVVLYLNGFVCKTDFRHLFSCSFSSSSLSSSVHINFSSVFFF